MISRPWSLHSDESGVGFPSFVTEFGLWDDRQSGAREGHVLLASPWGFRCLITPSEFNAILEKPLFDIDMETAGTGT